MNYCKSKKRDQKVAEHEAKYRVDAEKMDISQLTKAISKLEKQMLSHAKNLEFEEAAAARNEINRLREMSLR